MKIPKLLRPPLFEAYQVLGFFSQGIPSEIPPENLLQSLYPGYKIFLPQQIHSDKIIFFTGKAKEIAPSDSIFTNLNQVVVGVKTADCVPILVATKDGSIVGAIHAGWRGSVKKILGKALNSLLAFGYLPENILIAIGPHIKMCCYKIGPEVIEEIEKNFGDPSPFIVLINGKTHLNLTELNLHQIHSFQIPQENIWLSEDCTYCKANVYYSHRFYKEKRKGYQLSFLVKT